MALQVFLLSYNAMPFIYILRACFAHHRNCRHCRQLVVFARGRLILSGKKVLAKNWQQVVELRFTKRLFLVVKNIRKGSAAIKRWPILVWNNSIKTAGFWSSPSSVLHVSHSFTNIKKYYLKIADDKKGTRVEVSAIFSFFKWATRILKRAKNHFFNQW